MVKKLKKVSRFSGEIFIPPDKSITHRAILLSALSHGTSRIQNPLQGEDCLSTLTCMQSLGITVRKKEKIWEIDGKGLGGFHAAPQALNCGNSGTTMRLLAGILAGQAFDSEMIGDASLMNRPMSRVSDPLGQMGAKIALRNGKFPPIQIKSSHGLNSIKWENKISSAQVKSAVLLAALYANGTTFYEEPLTSRDHTERMLAACGVSIQQDGNQIAIKGGTELKPQNWIVPGDFSSAAFFVVAGLIVPGAQVKMNSVNINPTRTGLLTALQHMGAKIIIGNRQERGGETVADLRVENQTELRSIRLEKRLIPHLIDEIPILAVAATQARGKTILEGIGELRVKETDRIFALAKNLTALGARVEEQPNALVINGPTMLRGALVDSFQDHRIAMAMGIASLVAEGETQIQGSESVAISYPDFWNEIKNLSA